MITTDKQIYTDIADFLADALKSVDEAHELADFAWKEKDKRTEALLELWAQVDAQFQQFHRAQSKKA